MTSTNNPRKIHPLMATAAGAVILVCAVATASMLGILPQVGARGDDTPLRIADQGVAAAQLSGEPGAQGQITSATPPAGARPAAQANNASKTARPAAATPAKMASATPVPTAVACSQCGVVESVREVSVPTGQSSGGDQHNIIGTLAGGVAGGVVGNQFGGGSGRDALTVLGAVGGAFAGREIQRNMRGQQSVTRYQTLVRFNDGSSRTFTTDSVRFASGDHVRLVDNRLEPR